MAYGCVLLMGMINPLKAEGFTLNIRDACIDLVSAWLVLRTVKEKVEIHKAVIKMFQQIAEASGKHANVKEWIDNSTQLVLLYVEQFTTTKPKLKEVKFLPLFGSQLKAYLSTHEPI